MRRHIQPSDNMTTFTDMSVLLPTPSSWLSASIKESSLSAGDVQGNEN